MVPFGRFDQNPKDEGLLAEKGALVVSPEGSGPKKAANLSCSVTLGKNGTLFWGLDHFSGAATKKKVGKRIEATEQLRNFCVH